MQEWRTHLQLHAELGVLQLQLGGKNIVVALLAVLELSSQLPAAALLHTPGIPTLLQVPAGLAQARFQLGRVGGAKQGTSGARLV